MDFLHSTENPWKFVEKQKMMITFFYIFHVYLDTSRRLSKERLAQKTFAQGNFWPRNFPQGGFCPRKTLFAKEAFVQEDVCPLEPLFRDIFCKKGHPSGKSMWFGADCWHPEIRHFGDYSREILTCKLRAASGTFALKNLFMFSVKQDSHMSNWGQRHIMLTLSYLTDQ